MAAGATITLDQDPTAKYTQLYAEAKGALNSGEYGYPRLYDALDNMTRFENLTSHQPETLLLQDSSDAGEKLGNPLQYLCIPATEDKFSRLVAIQKWR